MIGERDGEERCFLAIVMRFYWKLSHLNEHIVDRKKKYWETDSETACLSRLLLAICLNNMMKMIFVFKSQTTLKKMYDQTKKYDYIWLYFMLVMMATTRRAQTMHLFEKKGCGRISARRWNHYVLFMWFIGTNIIFNENYHCHVRNVRYRLCNVINVDLLNKMNIIWVTCLDTNLSSI